jgi:hypothetical protein
MKIDEPLIPARLFFCGSTHGLKRYHLRLTVRRLLPIWQNDRPTPPMNRWTLPPTPDDNRRHHPAGASRRCFSRDVRNTAAYGLRSRAVEFIDAGQIFED